MRLPLLATTALLLLGACSDPKPADQADAAPAARPPAAAAVTPATPVVAEVPARLETPAIDTDTEADADDPAIWLHPTDPARSLVVTAVKDAGLRVYDLSGNLVQRIDATPAGADGLAGRYNNVDVTYGFTLADGRVVDLAVAADRGRDLIRVWRIDPADPARPLVDITDPGQGTVYPTRRGPDGTEVPNPAADQHTAYGLTTWNDVANGAHYAIVAARKEPRLVQHRLLARPDGTVGHERVRHWDFPTTHRGQDLWQESEEDPRADWSAQFEGLVVDQERAILFAGQEDVGLWRIDLRSGIAEDKPFYETRGSTLSPFNHPESRIVRDVEGFALHYGPDGSGYLVVSSQGDAHGDDRAPDADGLDDSFAVFERGGQNRYLGSFRVVASGGVDAVQECDGADIVSYALPGFPGGLMVMQDGYNDDLNDMSGEPKATNFKYVDWQAISAAFPGGLAITPTAFDPRKITPVR